MGEEFSVNGNMKNMCEILFGKPERRRLVLSLDIKDMIILKQMLVK
jgi:hypothetical protein